MDIKTLRKHCGFYTKGQDVIYPDEHFCEMRCSGRSIYNPEFTPSINGECFDDVNECPVYKILMRINEDDGGMNG